MISEILADTDFHPQTISVTRPGADTYDAAGLRVAGAGSSFSILAGVQPVNGNQLQLVPEGHRSEDVKVLYTGTELRTKDIVTIGGEAWTIVRVLDHPGFGEPHWEAYAARKVAP